MIKKKSIMKVLCGAIVSTFMFGMATPVFAQSEKTEAVVTLGANLTKSERLQMLDAFGVKANEVKIIDVTNQDIREQLGLDTSKPIPAKAAVPVTLNGASAFTSALFTPEVRRALASILPVTSVKLLVVTFIPPLSLTTT